METAESVDGLIERLELAADPFLWKAADALSRLQRELQEQQRVVEGLLAARNMRVILGKDGKGFAYVRGKEYPIEGPGDGSRFATFADAAIAAIKEK